MSNDDLLVYLDGVTDPRFAEAATILKRAIQAPGSSVAVSRRFVPTAELSDIYTARRDLCRSRNIHVPGVEEFVDILMMKPGVGWRIVSISGGGLAGAVFLTEAGDVCACVAGKDASADAVE